MGYFNQEHPNGIDGHQVNLVLLNDASDVTTAVNVANQLVADKSAAIVTLTTNPAAALQQLAVFKKAKMPVIANLEFPALASAAKQARQYPYLFSPNPSSSRPGWPRKPGSRRRVHQRRHAERRHPLRHVVRQPHLQRDPVLQGEGDHGDVTPGAVDDSAAITQLKARGPSCWW